VARGYRAWMLYELTESMAQAGHAAQARELARQSIFLRPTVAAIKLIAGMRRIAAVAVPHRSEAP
jgi:hypothetical protein